MEIVEQEIAEKPNEQMIRPDLKNYVQQQLLYGLGKISGRFGVSGQDVIFVKDTLKAEFMHILDDVSKTSQDIKQDLFKLSARHKDHLLETFKNSKDEAVRAVSKLKSTVPLKE